MAMLLLELTHTSSQQYSRTYKYQNTYKPKISNNLKDLFSRILQIKKLRENLAMSRYLYISHIWSLILQLAV